MKVGDIVKAMGTKDLRVQNGIILSQLPDMELGLQVFEVMTCDGVVQIYTSAALRKIK